MAIKSLCNAKKPNSTEETTLYIAGSNTNGVPILKFVAANDTGAAATFYVKVYSATGAVDSTIPVTPISRYTVKTFSALSGVVIPPNGRLAVGVNPASSVNFTVSGEV
jgi:hypothetical protein